MSSKTTVKLNNGICDRARAAAKAAGYSSLEEFIEHAIEKELANRNEGSPESTEELARKLKGLGYIK